MALITFQGSPIHTSGELPVVGRPCPPFVLTRDNLTELSLVDLEGQRVVLNIFPSVDTATCAKGVYTFDARAEEAPDTVVVCVSADLPFAQRRFREAAGIDHALLASTFRHPEFGRDFGVTMADGPFKGLLARAVVALDENGTVVHTELVAELACEATYDWALDIIHQHHHPCPEDALLTSE
ncbi:MAG: thiol peroxidase [Holophagaceae bacterium]|nr:thiol peroxidase [Holophagaceae bacterium]